MSMHSDGGEQTGLDAFQTHEAASGETGGVEKNATRECPACGMAVSPMTLPKHLGSEDCTPESDSVFATDTNPAVNHRPSPGFEPADDSQPDTDTESNSSSRSSASEESEERRVGVAWEVSE